MDRRRRRFLQSSLALAGLGLLSGCGISAAPARPRVYRVGYLTPDSPATNASVPRLDAAFRDGLRELGYVEGQNLTVEARSSELQYERLPELAAELVRLPVDVLVTRALTPTAAAKSATASVPIVGVNLPDPVEAGLVASLAHPGGNLTGLANLTPQLAGKRLEFLVQVAPGISRLGVLWNPTGQSSLVDLRQTSDAASAVGLQVVPLEVRAATDFAAAFESAVAQRAEALLVTLDSLIQNQRREIFEFAARQQLPTMCGSSTMVEAGGLMYYGANSPDLFRRAATYVDRILKGAKPADLPIEQPTKFDFLINLKTAQTLRLAIPQSVLLQATEIFE